MAITRAQQVRQMLNGGGAPSNRGDTGGPPGRDTGGNNYTDRIMDVAERKRRQDLRDLATRQAEDKAFEQQGFETLRIKDSNFPGIGGMILNALKGPRQKILDRNIDFFRNDPRTRKAREKYGLTAQGYKDYMSARIAGTIDAAGNPLNQDDDNNIILPVDTTFAQAPSNMDQEPEVEDPFVLARRFRADGGIMNADVVGGEFDFESARQMYGLGKLVKKVTRTVKKIAKSPVGQAAILAATYKLGGGKFFGGEGFKFSNLPGLGFLKPASTSVGAKAAAVGLSPRDFMMGIGGKTSTGSSIFSSIPGGITTGILGTSVLAGLLTPEEETQAEELSRGEGIDIEAARNAILAARQDDFRARRFRAEGGLMRIGYDQAGAVMSEKEMKKLAKSPLYKGFKIMYDVDPNMARENEKYKGKFLQFEQLYKKGFQKGGDVEPVAKKTMPLLDLDGKEMDLRAEGGFVPIGRMEKADDVPARLSKNEFVFTADAVRNAGDGDVDKGAEVMYNMMKNLEAGGEVSKESQGLEGARRMFQTSKRLEEVL